MDKLSKHINSKIAIRTEDKQIAWWRKNCLNFCCLCCLKSRKYAKERDKRGSKQIEKEFDLNYIVKVLRFHKVLMKSATSKEVRHVSKYLSARYISQSEHDSLIDSVYSETEGVKDTAHQVQQHESHQDKIREISESCKKEAVSIIESFCKFIYCKKRKQRNIYLSPITKDDHDAIKKVCQGLDKIEHRRLISYYLTLYDENHTEETAVVDLEESGDQIVP